MRYFIHIVLFLLAVQLHSQENYRVTDVNFKGNASVKSSILLNKMSLQPKSGLKRLTDRTGVSFSGELLKNDIKDITYYYQQIGFIHASVSAAPLDVNDKKETVEITILIDEGEPVHVSALFFNRSDTVHHELVNNIFEKTRSKLLMTEGSRFNEISFLKDVDMLTSELLDNGFAFSEVDYRLDVNAEQNTVDIHLNVNTGPLAYFGNVSINGNDDVPGSIIRKQLAFDKGDVFSRRKIDKSQEQIYALNVFHIVSLNARIQKQKEAAIPVTIRIREAPRFTHKYGIGWGREDKFRALVDVQWLRFLGGARRLNLFLKHSALEPYHINLEFVQPAFLHPNASLGINPFLRQQHEPAYKINRLGSNLFIQRQITNVLSAGATYTFETVTLDTNSVADIKSQPDITDLYNKSSITLGIVQNTTNDIFYPSQGYNTGLTVKYSGIGPSTYTYLKGIIDVRHYTTIPRAILAMRLKVGQINSHDASGFIPVEDRFFSGGANSNRGWARHELGPTDSNGKPIGGKALLEGSVEFRIPLFGSLNLAAFWDMGNVWESRFEKLPTSMAHALGLGLRYRTPIGPIRLDIATPVYNGEHQYRWHLSIGEAF